MNDIIAEEVVRGSSYVADEAPHKLFPIIINSDGETFSITNSGTAPSLCSLTVVPQNDIMLLTIKGLTDEPITFEKLKKGQMLTINGLEGSVLVNGEDAADSFHGWEMPKLQPGVNQVSINNANILSLSVEYSPNYI
jgi:phage-related protein